MLAGVYANPLIPFVAAIIFAAIFFPINIETFGAISNIFFSKNFKIKLIFYFKFKIVYAKNKDILVFFYLMLLFLICFPDACKIIEILKLLLVID